MAEQSLQSQFTSPILQEGRGEGMPETMGMYLLEVSPLGNAFAHELHGLSFSDGWVKAKCAELRLPRKVPSWSGLPNARQPFTVAISLLWLELGMRRAGQQHRVVPGEFEVAETVD